VARGLAAVALFATTFVAFVPGLPLVLLLWASTALIALRWRGSVNGGSDFMTLVVLGALSVARAAPERPLVSLGCLWYVAIQACNSYFIAGLVKLKAASWRQGRALPAFLADAAYDASALRSWLTRHPRFARVLGWAVMALECSFPLALVHPTLCTLLVTLALAFHIANVYVFGLNRFLWAWAATYPALFFASHHLGQLLFGR